MYMSNRANHGYRLVQQKRVLHIASKIAHIALKFISRSIFDSSQPQSVYNLANQSPRHCARAT